ncbi:MAG: bifunctional phosphoglucose/phosphomannose isomerase [Gemmatimonadales bacterium]|nr:bifunctional phosphoglucose/phosphomannose isomerase [Gemmatimonadales bacterium]
MSAWSTDGTQEMMSLVAAFPDHLAASAGLNQLGEIAPLSASCRRILFCGMGGSAIAGELVQPVLQDQRISLTVWRDYGLPHWVGEEDLVVAASYSGNTEETLSALAAARSIGCRVLGLSSGGILKAMGGKEDGTGFPVVELPGGFPPRASLGYGLGGLLHLLAALGVIREPDEEIDRVCRRLRDDLTGSLLPWNVKNSQAWQAGEDTNISAPELALDLQEKIPVIYTAGPEAHGPGSRWKAQLNENAKIPACLVAFPELNHNDLVGWSLPEDLRTRFALIILESGNLDSRARIRVDATMKLLADEFSSSYRIVAKGDTPLSRVLSLVQYGDLLSCHLAHLAGVDSMPVDRIESLKKILSLGQNP